MDQHQLNHALIEFLAASPTPFHAVAQMAARLSDTGFEHLDESATWPLVPGGRYWLSRNDSSILAWRMPTRRAVAESGFRMVGAHTDSPGLKVKPQPEFQRHGCLQLGVEVYGGALLNPWFDRDLSMAGRVSYLSQRNEVAHALLDFAQAIAIIPSLAIHLDREANQHRSINAQTYLPPILGQTDEKPDFKALLHKRLEADGVTDIRQVLDYELFFYDTQLPQLLGLAHEFLASARLDNLLSCFVGLQALTTSAGEHGALLVCNDHEEVGSTSAAGACGPMLTHTLERVMPDTEARGRALARSMLISTDNAHGVHPNFSDRHDDNHAPRLNRGVVIKHNANQRYASNSETSAILHKLAVDADVPVQDFVVRSDMACGSTIGPLTAAQVGVRTLDIGVPQWAMHSIREVVGTADALHLYRILLRFFDTERV